METRVKLGDFKADQRTRRYINQVLDTGRISYGPLSGRFEAEFSIIHGCRYGILSNSGTSSLQIALQAMKELYGWNDGDEVIVPALTFVATANIVLHNRMKPVFVDVDIDTFAIDVGKIENAITNKTRAIIPVNPFGLPADLDMIDGIAKLHGLKVIEDSAECMYVSVNNQSVGSWGDIGCFSFYVAHLLTMGVGGIGITNDLELATKMRSLANHGIEDASLPIGEIYDPSHLGRHFRFTSIGHSFRVTELEAAVGLAQLEDIANIIDARQTVWQKIAHSLSTLESFYELCFQRVPENRDNSCMVFPIVGSETTEKTIAYLRAFGIECRELLPLINQPCYSMLNIDFNKYPVSMHLNQHGLYLPCHQYMTDYQIDYMSQVIGSLYKICNPPM